MDRTSNDLLHHISNLTSQSVNPINPAANPTGKPVDDALIDSLLQAAAQMEPDAVESLVEEFSSEFSADELLAAAQALVGDEDLLGESDNQAFLDTDQAPDQISRFAKDPYVAEADDEIESVTAVPKSIEDILRSISGYQLDETENRSDSRSQLESTVDATIDSLASEPDTTKSTPAEQTGLAEEIIPTSAKTRVVDASSAVSSSGLDGVEMLDETAQPEFNVNAFSDAREIVEGTPAPIRGAFELDQEFFDYQVIEAADSDACHPATNPSELDSPVESPSPESPTAEASSENEAQTATDDNYFWANTGDIIKIDGNQGFGHIDLACFDISDATFHGNQIQIACDDGTSFLIEYCNVTHAVFADGVEIELIADDTDSDQE